MFTPGVIARHFQLDTPWHQSGFNKSVEVLVPLFIGPLLSFAGSPGSKKRQKFLGISSEKRLGAEFGRKT